MTDRYEEKNIQIEEEESRRLLIQTGFADYLINIIENDIHELFDGTEYTTDLQYKKTTHRFGQWYVNDDINISERGFVIFLTIEEAVSKRWFKVEYLYDKWYLTGRRDLKANMEAFAETYRKRGNFHKPDTDTTLYKSIYGETKPMKYDRNDYTATSIHPSEAEVCNKYNTKESLALINEAGFNMALMCMVMNTYKSDFSKKCWKFKNDQVNILVFQDTLFVGIVISQREYDPEDDVTYDEPCICIHIFKQNSDIDMVSYVDDPKNYLVSVRSILEDAKVVDPEQFAYFVKLFKEV